MICDCHIGNINKLPVLLLLLFNFNSNNGAYPPSSYTKALGQEVYRVHELIYDRDFHYHFLAMCDWDKIAGDESVWPDCGAGDLRPRQPTGALKIL